MPCALTVHDEQPRDLRTFCDECEVKKQWDFFIEAATRELERRFDGHCEWSFNELYADVSGLILINRETRKGYPRGCDALLAKCLDLWRAEEYRPRRIHLWELQQKKPGD